jgi:predicted AAA+ superfamily ATPase
MAYVPRVAEAELDARLRRSGAVLVEGAKACGKTEMALRAAASVIRVETDPNVGAFMEVDPGRILAGATPRLLDEWQWEPRLWDFVRQAVDDRQTPGQFILTGSATPNDDARKHSGVGRISPMRLRTMSLWELGKSTGDVSWEMARRGGEIRAEASGLTVEDLARLVLRGGAQDPRLFGGIVGCP